MSVSSTKLKIEAKIFSYRNPPQAKFVGFDPINLVDVSDYIISWNYSKNLGDPAGSFEILLKTGIDIVRIIKPGDWIVIKYTHNNIKINRCIGMIDRISKNISVMQDGKRSISFRINGRDIGKIFSDTTLMINLWGLGALSKDIQALSNISDAKGKYFTGSPDEVVTQILKLFLGNIPSNWPTTLFQYQIPDPVIKEIKKGLKGTPPKASSIIKARGLFSKKSLTSFNPQSIPLGNHNKSSVLSILDLAGIQEGLHGTSIKSDIIIQLVQQQYNLWEVLKSCQNSLVNEMFIELSPYGMPTFYFRNIPFIDETMRKSDLPKSFSINQSRKTIPYIEIESDDVISMDLGFTEAERYNYFFIIPKDTASGKTSEGLCVKYPDIPHINETSIRRYGVKPYVETIDYCSLIEINNSNIETKTFEELAADWNRFIKTIYNNNPYYESGTIVIKGNPYVRVGNNLIIKYDEDNIYSYYIEGYTDTWDIDESGSVRYLTSVIITRGYQVKSKGFISNRKGDRRIENKGVSTITGGEK